jgi:hypothetical protein
MIEIDAKAMPSISELRQQMGGIDVIDVPIPYDCIDGFWGAYWRRPEAYLQAEVRNGISFFPTWHISSRVWSSCGQTLNPAPDESATLQFLRSMNSTLAIDYLLHRTGRARCWALNIKRSDPEFTSSLHEQLGG